MKQRSYEDLSRRALVQLGHDYDAETDNALQTYLGEHDDSYEGIRPVEKVIEKTDEMKEMLSKTSINAKQIMRNQMDKLLDKMVNGLNTMLDSAAK